jgi:predicted RNA binding protein YcfA (HicA-like mRNA interferase family)
MVRKQSDVEAALLQKGFRRADTHHRYFIYHTEAGPKSRIRTRTSHGGRDITEALLRQMARQCGISRKDFLDLVDCPLDQSGYEAKVAGSL